VIIWGISSRDRSQLQRRGPTKPDPHTTSSMSTAALALVSVQLASLRTPFRTRIFGGFCRKKRPIVAQSAATAVRAVGA
jgi:hypothetical protein